jgi:hypothetical protein
MDSLKNSASTRPPNPMISKYFLDYLLTNSMSEMFRHLWKLTGVFPLRLRTTSLEKRDRLM